MYNLILYQFVNVLVVTCVNLSSDLLKCSNMLQIMRIVYSGRSLAFAISGAILPVIRVITPIRKSKNNTYSFKIKSTKVYI
jgi:hypothetical protein